MVSTFQALAVALLAMLPGGLYTWAYERRAGAWGIGLSDRLFRFVGASALFHATTASLTYELYREFVHSGRLERAEPLPPGVWSVPVLYVLVPVAVGWSIGEAVRARKPWALHFTGPSPAPRAWDHLFSTRDLEGWVRIMLHSGEWIAGAYAKKENSTLRSYAAGYPEAQDLYLAERVECDEDGTILVDENGDPLRLGVGVLVRWEEVTYLEFIEA
jgi:hypothetical protein